MKKLFFLFSIITVLLFLFVNISYSDDISDLFEDLIGGNKKDLSDQTIASGLKEALSVGTKRAIKKISKKNGYFKNPKIRIPLPEKLKKAEKILRPIGFHEEFDEFVLSMNRAAEKAAPIAVDIFVDSIKQMTIQDAVGIWKKEDDSATKYFKKTSYTRLYKVFFPIVKRSINSVGVTMHYNKIKNKTDSMPFLNSYLIDIDEYVTNKALKGLFIILAEEEKAIRENPAKRTTELLRKLFG